MRLWLMALPALTLTDQLKLIVNHIIKLKTDEDENYNYFQKGLTLF